MFTEGLDPHALQWVQQQRTDHLRRRYQGEGGGLGLPPPEKFGRFPRAAHVIPNKSEVGSDSDDFSVDTENEVYESRYSIESSPQNDTLKGKVYSNGGGRFRSGNQYSSEGYSEFSSSRDSVGRRRYKEEEEEEDDTDFDGSSEFVGRGRGGNAYGAEEAAVNLKVSYRGEGGGGNVKAAVNEDCNSDVPSAPPFHGSHEKISQVSDQLPSSEAYSSTCPVGSNGYLAKVDARSQANFRSDIPKQKTGSSLGCEPSTSSCSLPARIPTFHACGLGPWYSVIAYEACIRLCLHSWASGCMEAPLFLENECAVLRNAFGLQQMLLQSEEELLAKQSSELVSEGATVKPKKIIGKLKIQVRKVRMDLDVPSGCNYLPLSVPVVKLESFRSRISNLQSNLSSEWESLRKVRVFPRRPAFTSFSKHSLAYMRASPLYLKQVSKLLKVGVTTLRSSSYETVQESYSCLLRLKSLSDEDSVRMQAGSTETHLFFPDSLGDDLIIEVYDSKGKFHGRVIAQVASIAENPNDKVRWWSIYREPEHELVGHIQLSINYTTSLDENSALKCGPVAETVAYDLVLEVAMKAQNFRQRNLLLHGSWKWLLTEFASYFGVSDTYTKLRYLSYVMDVATLQQTA